MKRLSNHLLIAALALALAACAGAPAPVVTEKTRPAATKQEEPDAPAAKATESVASAPEPATASPAPLQQQEVERVVERDAFAIEEEVAAPTLEKDPRSLIAQARQALDRDQREEAAAFLNEALTEFAPGTPARLEAAELLVTLLMDDGRYGDTLELLSGLGQPLNDCLLRSLALAAEIEGNTLDTVDAYLQLLGLVDEMERDELNQRIGYLMDRLDEAELETLAGERMFSRVGGYAALRLAKLRISQKRPEEAEPILWRLQFLFGGEPIGESADALVRRLVASRTQSPGHFGVMLPMSGKLSLFGQRVLRGIVLASNLLTADEAEQAIQEEQVELAGPGNRPITLHIFDTNADPERARQGVIELADKGVIGIIGPLKGSAAHAAAQEARALGVPLLTPTPSAEVEGEGVFRLGLRPEDEIDRLARYAIEEAGIQRFAILAPDTDKGRNYRRIFWDSVVRHGGEIAGAALFEPGKNISLETAIAKVTDIHRLSKTEKRERFDELRHKELVEAADLLVTLGVSPAGAREMMAVDEDEEYADYEPKPRVDFSGVFLPISAKAAALLAPQLPYHDVFDNTLLGLRSWNHSTLVKVGREYVEGALLPVEWTVETPEGKAFAESYKAEYKRAPGVLEVYGFDAGVLALDASLKGAAATREDFQLLLSRLWAEQAVTGPLTTHPSGVIASEPKILTVKRGRFIPAPISESN